MLRPSSGARSLAFLLAMAAPALALPRPARADQPEAPGSSYALIVGSNAGAELRQQILRLPSTLTVVIVDACQSGAFSRIKGAEATADFSFNSVARLNTAGMAVMASSTANELSQESDELGSSYFTHNLLLALRGAGDANQDGQVSLDEAYRYTYNRTLTGWCKACSSI